MKKNSFTMIDENGKEIEYEVLFTFDSDETGKSYIVYTDNTLDETGNIVVYASTYNPEDSNQKLEEIETEQEWKVIETILETLQEEVRNKLNKKENEQ